MGRAHETPSASLLAAFGYTEDKTRFWRGLGSALDALIRALCHKDPLAPGLCRRVHGLWAEQGGTPLSFDGAEIKIDGKLALAADGQSGRFILPAYSAGLRSLRMRKEASPQELLCVAQEFASLVQSPRFSASFQQWLWSDPEGFEVEVGFARDDLIDRVLSDESIAEGFYAGRSRAIVAAWNQQALAAARELEPETIANDYRRPVERLQKLARDPRLELSKEELRALAWAADDAGLWGRVETDAMFAHPELFAHVSSEQLCTRIIAMLHAAPKVTGEQLALLQRVTTELPNDSGARALNSRRLGRAVARRVALGEVPAQELADAIDDLGRHTRSGAATELLERGVAEPDAWAALATMMQRWRMSVFADAVDLRRLEPDSAVSLYTAALKAQVPASALAELAAHLPPAAAVAVLCRLPPILRLSPGLCERLLTRQPAHCVPLVEKLFTCEGGVERVGEVLLKCQAEGYGERIRNVVMHGLVSAGAGERYVLPICRSRAAQVDARLAALAALESTPALLAQAIKRRPSDALEPAELRERLERLRKEKGS